MKTRTIYTVSAWQPGAQKPLNTEYHYHLSSANYRAELMREQARRNGWRVDIRVEQRQATI